MFHITLLFIFSISLIYLSPIDAVAKVLGYWTFDDQKKIGEDSSHFKNNGQKRDKLAGHYYL